MLIDSFQCTLIRSNIVKSLYQWTNETDVTYNDCFVDAMATVASNITTERMCEDILHNGTIITFLCMDDNFKNNQCDSVLKVLDFWGASMVIFATILYTIPYVVVVVLYCAIPDLRIRAYDKSVVAFNASYIILNCLLIFIGSFELCHKILPNIVYGILGLIILYLTQATVSWLFIICVDMTSVITRFRWVPASDSKKRDHKKKFAIYSACVFGISSVPTVIATIMEFNSFLPQESSLRPNFSNFHGKHNISVIIYRLIMPVSVLLANTVLLIYTTYKIIRIRRDNAILNIIKKAKKKYFIYIKLCLIFYAPWLSGALSEIFPSLWIFKFVRMIQPILMLVVIIPRKNMIKALDCLKRITRRYHINRFRNRIRNLRNRELREEQIETCIASVNDNSVE